MARKLDLFGVLKSLDQRNFDTYKMVCEHGEIKKELDTLSGWMLPIWMTGTDSIMQTIKLTERFDDKANGIWDSLGDHPELRVQLLASCGLGEYTKHKFYKRAGAKYNSGVYKLLRISHPDIRKEEVNIWIGRNDTNDLKELAIASGYQSAEIKDLVKVFNKMKKELL